MEKTKKCIGKCGKEKAISEFVRKSNGSGTQAECKICRNAKNKIYRDSKDVKLNDNFRNGLLYKDGTNLVTRVYSYLS